MLFDKVDNQSNENIIYKTKPSMIFGCKKVIYGIIILAFVIYLAPYITRFVGGMQVSLSYYFNLSLTRYVTLAFFTIILVDIVFIVWQLLRWFSTEYILTDIRIIVKTGLLYTKKNYLSYTKIQDVNTSQSFFARVFDVGSVSLFSAYDNNQMDLDNIPNPAMVETIIFENMMHPTSYHQPSNKSNSENLKWYDDLESHESARLKNKIHSDEGWIYPQHDADTSSAKYEYEPYREDYGYSNDNYTSSGYEEPPKQQSNTNYYNEERKDYSSGNENYYEDGGSELYYNDPDPESFKSGEDDAVDETGETAIKRHFDKFKR